VNNRFNPPERITSKSSMQSAPHAIPAMIEVNFPTGFAPADLTFVASAAIWTFSPINSDRPARSANANTGASPVYDTRLVSSNRAAARDHASGSFTSSAFRCNDDQGLDNPDPPCPEGTFS
jgi:hypothetical protein